VPSARAPALNRDERNELLGRFAELRRDGDACVGRCAHLSRASSTAGLRSEPRGSVRVARLAEPRDSRLLVRESGSFALAGSFVTRLPAR
jgi:hypothetical protein